MSANETPAPAPEAVATAYHEAGHAVAALALDRPVHKVSIRPDRDKAGICAFGKAVFRPSEDWLEREVLIALADGLSDKEIGERLAVSPETIRSHMVSIFAKLNVESRLQALLFAMRHGAINLDQLSAASSEKPNAAATTSVHPITEPAHPTRRSHNRSPA
jgi:DNA-binding CsgD family transcriptional regulator